MRVHRIAGLLVLCLLLWPVRNITGGESHAVQYNARLKVSTRLELERRLNAPFTEGTAHPPGVSNCAQLLARRGQTPKTQQSNSEFQAMRSTMAECLVLRELQRARPARRSYIQDLIWDEHVLSILPPELAISASGEAKRAAQAAALHGKTWAEFDPSMSASAKGTDRIMVSGKEFREQLILWGRGDFNGDGKEDLLVQSLDTLTEGTYRNTRLFVLTRNSADAPLSVVRELL